MPANDRWNSGNDILESFNKPDYPELAVEPGMRLTHTGSGTAGSVAGFSVGDIVVLVDDNGARHHFRAHDGAFTHRGVRVALRSAPQKANAAKITASGSIAAEDTRARVAAASRIWVEGIHDAELIEKVWGDDLRACGIVVEPLHGADDLTTAVDAFAPGRRRRLGILLDHLIAGTKEWRLAGSIANPNVLVCGHPYVDVWAAVSPATIGIAAWPDVPRGVPWKEGVINALGLAAVPGEFWGRMLDSVSSYRDLETPLINAVEQLIDFVTIEPASTA